MYHFVRAVLVSSFVIASASFAQDTSRTLSEAEPATGEAGATPSVAQEITRLEKSIRNDEQLLTELRERIGAAPDGESVAEVGTTYPSGQDASQATGDQEGEFARAKAQFSRLDDQLMDAQQRLAMAEQEGHQKEADGLKPVIEDLEKQWRLAKDRFDLAIQERNALQEQMAVLQAKLGMDRKRLKNLHLPETQPAEEPVQQAVAAPAPASSEAAAVIPSASGQATAAEQSQPDSAEPLPGTAASDEEAPAEHVLEARKAAEIKQNEAKRAEQRIRSIDDQLAQLDRSIATQQQLQDILTGKMTNARETEQSLLEQLRTMSEGQTDPGKLKELSSEIADARTRRTETQQDLDQRQEEIQRLQAEKSRLQSQRIAAMQQADKAREESALLQRDIAWLENPFAPRNLVRWLVEKAPKMGGVVLGMLVLLWLVRVLTRRVVHTLTRRSDHVSKTERENRAHTLASVFQNAAAIAIMVGGGLTLMQVVEIPIAPILGGAAVFGLAIAFGAQNLIKDYFYGFMILLESQYCVNDVVKICGIGGLVERVTLRVTVLRDLEGVAHFIPNGQITTVSNMTHVWSRALFDIDVAYKEDVDQVMSVLMDIGRSIRQDSRYSRLILDDPEMLGVDQFSDSAVVIRFFMKTRPLQQWTVKREMLRRIKNRFDELGIEIPFPHRTIYHGKMKDADVIDPAS